MPKKWSEVTASPDFQSLPAAEQEEARQQYFATVIAPRVPKEDQGIAQEQFNADTRIAKQDLPQGVKPSRAGAGRGIAAGMTAADVPAAAPAARTPTARSIAADPVASAPAELGNPAGDDFGASIMAAQPADAYIERNTTGGSVLDRPPPAGIVERAPTREQAIEMSKSPATQAEEARRLRYLQGDGSTISESPPETFGASALRSLDRKPLDQSLGGAALEVGADAARGLAKSGPGLAVAAYGGVQLAADLAGADRIADWAAKSSKVGGNYLANLDNPNGDKLVTGAFQSLGSAMIGAQLGGVAGAVGVAGGQTFGEKYSELRAGGIPVASAVEGATVHGLAEILGERMGMKSLGRLVEGIAKKTGISPVAALKEAAVQQGEEQATLAIQTLYDKFGSGTLKPNVTLDDYLKDVVDTAAQTAIMTAAAGGAGGIARGAQALVRPTPYDIAGMRGFHVEPPLTTDDPVTLVKRRVTTFQNVAAQYGIPPAAVKRAVETAKTMPAEDVGPFLKTLVGALGKRGMVQAEPDPAVIATLDAAPVQPPPEVAKTDSDVTKPAAEVATSPKEAAVDRIGALLGVQEPAAGTTIDEAARAAAPSPTNDRPEPTQAQKDAGNYAKGHLKLAGLDISIENDEGSMRSGVGADGKAWSNKLNHHYGYIRRTEGADGEQVDTFIKPGTTDDNAGPAFVVDQIDPQTGKFDEHKVMLGFDTEQEARDAYQSNYAKGWKGLGAITQVDQPGLKEWIRSDAAKKPFAPAALESGSPAAQAAPALETAAAPAAVETALGPTAGARTIGTAGTTPKTATPLELRANEDGTVTPWHDGAELLDYESGDPVRLPAAATDQEALDAIKAAGSFGRRTKVYHATPSAVAAATDAPAPTSVAADLEAMRDKDRGYRAPDDVRDAITKAGLSAADKFKDTTWGASVADGRGDLAVEVDPATGNATVTGEYMGKPVFTREAKGGAAIGAALDEARAGLEEGERRRKAAQTTKLPAAEAPTLPPPPPASPPAEKPKRPGTAQKAASADRNPFKAFLGRRGISIDIAADFAPGQAERRKAMVPGYGPIFRKNGMQLDELAERAAEDGFLPPGTQDVATLTDMIQRVLRGERIAPLYAEGVAESEMQARVDREMQDAEDAALELEALPDDTLADIEDLWNGAAPPQSTADAMRALGFDEQEISYATAAKGPESSASGEGDRGAAAPATGGSEASDSRGDESARDPEGAEEGLTPGLVTIPADESALAEALAPLKVNQGEVDFADGEDARYAAVFHPTIEPVSLPRTSSKNPKPAGVEWLTKEEADAKLASWKAEAMRQGDAGLNSRRTVISLFDASGVISQPWVDAGYNVYNYDLQNGTDISEFDAQNLMEAHDDQNIWAIIGQPPCTDFAASGSRWWKDKDADGRTEASNELVMQNIRTVELFRPAVWVMENPVGRIAKLNKLPKPLLQMDPWHYGDPYTKRTLLWGNFDPNLPQAFVEPVEGSKMHKMSSSAKYERSLTPEGFAYAFFMANNAEGMAPARRLALEYGGVDQDLIQGAMDAGASEADIRTAIEDSYYDNDLEAVSEELEKLADKPKAKGETEPGPGQPNRHGVYQPTETFKAPITTLRTAKVDLAPLPDGRWMWSHELTWHTGEGGQGPLTDHPTHTAPSHDEALRAGLEYLRQQSERPGDYGLTKKEKAGKALRKWIDGELAKLGEPAPALTSPTPESLKADDKRARDAEAADRKEQKRLADKAKADAEAPEFTLTGSDRPADVAAAAGQGDIFAAPAEKAPAAPKLPNAAAQERAFANDFAALAGRDLVQTVAIAGTSQTATIKIDAAQAMRLLERRERVLRELRDCIGRAS